MIDEFALHRTRELVNVVRYFDDRHDTTLGKQPATLEEVTDEFYRSAIEINEHLTPKLEQAIKNVCSRLKLQREVIHAFVNNSHEVQAACYYVGANTCLIRLTSALVNLLEPEEAEFVIAHEIGHFLLKHAPSGTANHSTEYFVFQRAKEISADRIGLIGCGNIEIAGSAFIKTASGLGTRDINPDLKTYLRQIKQISANSRGENPFGTHPSIILRAYALDNFNEVMGNLALESFNHDNVFQCDKQISEFFDKYSDTQVNARVNEAKEDLKVWLAASMIVADRRFTKDEQRIFEAKFGSAMLEKFKTYLSTIQPDEIEDEIQQKLRSARNRLTNLIPTDAKNAEHILRKELQMSFNPSV
jgi:hypothetical protein